MPGIHEFRHHSSTNFSTRIHTMKRNNVAFYSSSKKQIKSAVEVTNNQTRKQKISKHLLKQNGRYVCSLQQKMMLEMQNGWTRFDGRFSTVLQLTRWRVYSIANPYNIRLYLYILYIYSIPTNTCYLLSLCEAIDVLCFVYSSSENPYNPLVTRHDDCVKCKW